MADPWDSMIALCHISNSQEHHLRTCDFAAQDPSPEDSSTSEDHFQTPPEERQPATSQVSEEAEVGLGDSVMEDVGVSESDVVPHQLPGNVAVDPAPDLPKMDGIGTSNANQNKTTMESPMLLPPHLMDLVYKLSGCGLRDQRKEDDDDAEDILEVARRAGMNIPRPRWWGDDPWWRKDSST